MKYLVKWIVTCSSRVSYLATYFSPKIEIDFANNNYLMLVRLRVDQSSGICALYEQMICENGGLLEQTKDGYECKCKDNFYGSRCEKSEWRAFL